MEVLSSWNYSSLKFLYIYASARRAARHKKSLISETEYKVLKVSWLNKLFASVSQLFNDYVDI